MQVEIHTNATTDSVPKQLALAFSCVTFEWDVVADNTDLMVNRDGVCLAFPKERSGTIGSVTTAKAYRCLPAFLPS